MIIKRILVAASVLALLAGTQTIGYAEGLEPILKKKLLKKSQIYKTGKGAAAGQEKAA